MGDLSDNFSREEFACRCGCGLDTPQPALVDLLERIRAALGGKTLALRDGDAGSGLRCPAHNKRVGGVPDSEHITGHAVDIPVRTPARRFEVVAAAFACGCRRIGVAKGFVHVDVASSKPSPTIWTY